VSNSSSSGPNYFSTLGLLSLGSIVLAVGCTFLVYRRINSDNSDE
jgi:hypothetical protein